MAPPSETSGLCSVASTEEAENEGSGGRRARYHARNVETVSKMVSVSSTFVAYAQPPRTSFKARIAADHAAVLQPDVDTPFTDAADVVKRLLPYHVYQQPQDDLEWLLNGGKGKRKATELEMEVSETKFALGCHKRLKALKHRFRQAQTYSGKYSAPRDQAYALVQAVIDSERTETAWVNSELRNARTELEKVERERRIATSAAARTSYYPAHVTASPNIQWYQPYPYAFAQPYTPPTQTATPVATAAPTATMTTYAPAGGTNVTPVPVATPVVVPSTSAPSAPSPAAPSVPATTPIPVQLPVISLPALHALGIVPVPAAAVQPGQPPPVAVLRGASANGITLSLEINVSALNSAQMNGLAVILNSIMARGAAVAAPSTASGAPPSSSVSGET
ncbi:hypothetical protein HGRIS_002689 [Hohenbuehelia grisea]|uniref:GLTSCR protein conserved domain-containing protein n=1 Tax=Hohenbuehelia grisea TaxID=104357 RepID=A0ABR3JMH2_9AGAR